MTAREIYDLLKLNEGSKRVLIVEDDAHFAHGLHELLVSHGHEVTWFVGLESLEGSLLIGWTVNDASQEVDLSTIEVVFQDHYFPSRSTTISDGTLVTRAFRQAHPGIRIFGMSSVGSANASMSQAGAVGAMRKALLGVTLGI